MAVKHSVHANKLPDLKLLQAWLQGQRGNRKMSAALKKKRIHQRQPSYVLACLAVIPLPASASFTQSKSTISASSRAAFMEMAVGTVCTAAGKSFGVRTAWHETQLPILWLPLQGQCCQARR